MKKILLLLPIIGICSSLFAQAPKVVSVQAQQTEGTKDVQITFQCSAKAGTSTLNLEVWFRENLSKTQWARATSLYMVDGTTLPANSEWNDADQIAEIYSHRLDGITDVLETKTLIWNAGSDAPDVSTEEAQIRVIAFYDKTDEFGGIKPASEQVSGWNGIDDGNGSTTANDSNGTAGTDTNGTNEGQDVYYLDSTQVGEVTSYTRDIAGYYAFEAFYDEPAPHNDYIGTEVKQLITVYDDAGTWRHDAGIGPWQLNPSLFPTLDSVGDWIATNALVSQGKVTYSDPAAGGGF